VQGSEKAVEVGMGRQHWRKHWTAEQIGFSLLVICIFASAAQGQQALTASAKVAGTVFVRDSAGNQSFVDGAKVKLNGPATLETETDGKGSYAFTAVPLGTYTLEAVSPGLEARQTVCISATEILVPLEPREVSSSVVVRADEAGSKEPAPSETISEKTLRDGSLYAGGLLPHGVKSQSIERASNSSVHLGRKYLA
jgi:hypothetical protein